MAQKPTAIRKTRTEAHTPGMATTAPQTNVTKA